MSKWGHTYYKECAPPMLDLTAGYAVAGLWVPAHMYTVRCDISRSKQALVRHNIRLPTEYMSERE